MLNDTNLRGSMTLHEIADAISAYHENLLLLAKQFGREDPANARYEFYTESGERLPKLDELAQQIRTLASKDA